MEFVVLTLYCYFLHLPFKFHFLHLLLLSLSLSLSLSLLAPLFENMEISKAEGKRSMQVRKKEEEEDEDAEEDNKKKRAATHSVKKGSRGGSTQPCCQVEDCTANMSDAKTYHRRHKVCEFHAKAAVVLLAGIHQRFCQQCSRFHELSEFDDTKRSCRRHLLGHNERRRKSSYDLPGEGSG